MPARVVWVAAALLIVAGCRGSDDDGLLTRSLEVAEAEMTALIGGTLAIDEGSGCVLLSGQPVVWPAGTTREGSPAVIRLPGGVTLRSGDSIRGGGGEIPAASLDQVALQIDGDLDEALACAPKAAFVTVFTARGGDISVTRG